MPVLPAARAVAAQQAFVITVPAIQKAPVLDGTLNDPEWKIAEHVRLGWDYSFRRPAEEATDAYVLADEHYIYVAFAARQREAITATQRVDDQPLDADDAVGVYFWPAGQGGNEYGFIANPAGTRYAISGENSAFSPTWEAVAKSVPGGYVVTERIPVGVMRGDGRAVWRVQFDRRIRATNQTMEWAHNPAQNSTDQNIYAGYMSGMEAAARNARTKPRLAVYGLGEIAPLGGSTSRAGADLAIPITQTSSFIATFHPDYSNVELDQQSIAPTAFPRRYSEVRPFFTQGGKDYNRFSCNDCVGWPLLYTPNIPTPATGYAVEGIEGQYTFDAFDAAGASRSDTGQTLTWSSRNTRYAAVYQRTGVDLPGVHDVAQYGQVRVGNAHNFSAYVTQGRESGSRVSVAGGGRYDEYGVNLSDAHTGFYAAYHDVGRQYGPVDAFNDLFDVRGPSVFAQHTFDNGPKAYVQTVSVSHDFERYRDHRGEPNFGVDRSEIGISTRTQWTMRLSAGHTYLRFPATPGGYTDQNGIYLAYGENTSTPSSITYNLGRFGDGFLHSTDLQASWRLTRLGTVSLEAFQTAILGRRRSARTMARARQLRLPVGTGAVGGAGLAPHHRNGAVVFPHTRLHRCDESFVRVLQENERSGAVHCIRDAQHAHYAARRADKDRQVYRRGKGHLSLYGATRARHPPLVTRWRKTRSSSHEYVDERRLRASGASVELALWMCQGVLLLVFLYSGITKATLPPKRLVEMGQTGVEGLPVALIRCIGASEILGSAGIVVPWATHTLPVLTPVAAACFPAIMILAARIHYRRGEVRSVALNVIVLAVAGFVAIGRAWGVPV